MNDLIANAIIFFVAGLIIGVFVGYNLRKKIYIVTKWDDSMVRVVCAFSVITIWALLNIYSIINPVYVVTLPVHTIMGVVAGGFFGTNIIKKKNEPTQE